MATQEHHHNIIIKSHINPAHPWIFQKMVYKPQHKIAPGTVVNVTDQTGKWLARGFYNRHSRICVRVLTTDANEAIDHNFFRHKIIKALLFRQEVLNIEKISDSYRIVHSEADGLSGLVIDRFSNILVVEFFAAGMYRLRETIFSILTDLIPNSICYYFAQQHVCKQESFNCVSPQPPKPVIINEHGLRFYVAPGSKHKTGFFLDQRDNRKLISQYCINKKVLDLCCNTGGFSIYAKIKGSAQEVTAIDIDEEAIDIARQNAHLNQAKIHFVQADVYTWLRDTITKCEQYDVVILDPPKMTRNRQQLHEALKKYYDINRLAMHVVKPGGILLTCSCTGLVSESDFLECLRRAAWHAKRTLQIFRISGAAPDHPFLINVPEGRYLKAVYAHIL
ncbi:MAG: class I SAM-dependent rRNA methyltransferase [Candidatus Bilamarchaeaceae archaeon]